MAEEEKTEDPGANTEEEKSQSEEEDLSMSKEDFEKLEKKLADLEKERNSERSRADKLNAEIKKLRTEHESEDERRERERKEYEEELAEREKKLKENELRFIKIRVMQEMGIPAAHENRIHGIDEASIREDAKLYKESLDETASLMANQKLAGGEPPKGGESKKSMSYSQFKNLPLAERAKLLEDDPDLIEKLLKE